MSLRTVSPLLASRRVLMTLVVALSAAAATAFAQGSVPPPSAPPPPPPTAPATGMRWQQTCENIPGGRLDFKVKERGQSGWELVTVLPNDSGFIACYKRPG